MNFQEYIYSLSNDNRLNILEKLKKFGEPNTVVSELFKIIPCVQNKRLDIRINENYLLWYECGNFWHPSHTYLFKTDSFRYLYHSYASGGDMSTIGLIKNDDTRIEFKVENNKDGIVIADAISTYIKGFDEIKPYSLEEKNKEVRYPCPIYADGFYVFRNDSIYLEYPTLFRGYKSSVEVEDINDIIWCEQSFSSTEASDTYATTLFFRKNKRKTYPMFSNSEYGNFQFVLELKKRVPHLLYGYSEEYKKIHKRNPEELMIIAESKIKK